MGSVSEGNDESNLLGGKVEHMRKGVDTSIDRCLGMRQIIDWETRVVFRWRWFMGRCRDR